jgi:hypothetical protein
VAFQNSKNLRAGFLPSDLNFSSRIVVTLTHLEEKVGRQLREGYSGFAKFPSPSGWHSSCVVQTGKDEISLFAC